MPEPSQNALHVWGRIEAHLVSDLRPGVPNPSRLSLDDLEWLSERLDKKIAELTPKKKE